MLWETSGTTRLRPEALWVRYKFSSYSQSWPHAVPALKLPNWLPCIGHGRCEKAICPPMATCNIEQVFRSHIQLCMTISTHGWCWRWMGPENTHIAKTHLVSWVLTDKPSVSPFNFLFVCGKLTYHQSYGARRSWGKSRRQSRAYYLPTCLPIPTSYI